MAKWFGVSLLALFLAGSIGTAQSKKDSLFGDLSPGDPAARKILESLCEDTASAMQDLVKAAAWDKPDKSGSVDLWNQTLSNHRDRWNEKNGTALKASRGPRAAALGGARSEEVKGAMKSFPPDWQKWGNVQYEFFLDLTRSNFIDWRHEMNRKIHSMDAGLEQDPGKYEEVRGQLQWVVDEIKDSRQKAERATTAADIERELRRFTRIWTLTGNLERTMKARKKYVEGFFSDDSNKPSKIKEGGENAQKLFKKTQGEDLLDPVCKRAAAAFAGRASMAADDYAKKYAEVQKMNKPVLDETLFDNMTGFEADKFELLKSIERFERFLHDRQDALR